ncbi:uncharacterized protein L969DRAFT_95109 [Mixia osmundae IAM 14324]|uniref:Uncharacterized protein n=1 Tax=Mixia osmundae (strain CBS 9802 / IAM 14324 / JCM 22182 / KY 12970) TaxID=764103 RepID=G7E756_MIXOS|nr:uncharacterized protein L969DRAFT_95109 [Mixia osmundae IAM 14324]KEI38948.1 hypothetical protein L969DRAFT_95109 [Mixia osmundae IAM 14324]GAA98666.1 hypothetical protein E5Q_05354 [Mixia osmundae IAM 14324]
MGSAGELGPVKESCYPRCTPVGIDAPDPQWRFCSKLFKEATLRLATCEIVANTCARSYGKTVRNHDCTDYSVKSCDATRQYVLLCTPCASSLHLARDRLASESILGYPVATRYFCPWFLPCQLECTVERDLPLPAFQFRTSKADVKTYMNLEPDFRADLVNCGDDIHCEAQPGPDFSQDKRQWTISARIKQNFASASGVATTALMQHCCSLARTLEFQTSLFRSADLVLVDTRYHLHCWPYGWGAPDPQPEFCRKHFTEFKMQSIKCEALLNTCGQRRGTTKPNHVCDFSEKPAPPAVAAA